MQHLEHPPGGIDKELHKIHQNISREAARWLGEIMVLGIGPAVLVTQPGEVFSETAIELRKAGQQMGYGFPWLVSYANGSYAYLPPANAFTEGGYEVGWARRVGLSRHHQDRITEAILPVLRRHVP